jgi:hypothetical protein
VDIAVAELDAKVVSETATVKFVGRERGRG